MEKVDLEKVDWEKFKEFLKTKCSNKKHINNLVNYSKKFGYLLFVSPLDFALEMKKITKGKKSVKRHVLQALASFSKFLDLKKDTDEYYKRFKSLRERAEIKWSETKIPQILVERISKEKLIEIVKKIKKRRLFATCILHLLTGLRTGELFFLIKNFENLNKRKVENGYVIELGYFRKTKKAFITLLHEDALKFVKEAYRSEKSYWKNIKEYGIRPYDFRRVFESLYDNLRSHEIDLLQGRLGTELTVHYTRDMESLAQRVLSVQEKILKEIGL